MLHTADQMARGHIGLGAQLHHKGAMRGQGGGRCRWTVHKQFPGWDATGDPRGCANLNAWWTHMQSEVDALETTPMHDGALHCLVLYYEAMPALYGKVPTREPGFVVSTRGEEYAMRGKESCKKAGRVL